jgi:two-component system, chemotaxis family, chemotaxis protein CheY
VLEASNGEGAALVYAQHQPDLVVADLIMPDGEGLELIKMLRRTYKEAKMIATTGGGRGGKTNYLFMAQSMGADYTIEKPFSAEQLLSIIRLAIETEPALPAMTVAQFEGALIGVGDS